jgi:hypothetical protein
VRARRADQPKPIDCALTVGGWPFGTLALAEAFREQRVDIPATLLRGTQVPVTIVCPDEAARVTLDHALVVPRTGAMAQRDSAGAKAPHDP